MVPTAIAGSGTVQPSERQVIRFVNTVPQARTFWGSVEVPKADLEPELERLWQERKGQFKQNRPGYRPGKAPPPKREDVERELLFPLYQELWEREFVQGLENYLKEQWLNPRTGDIRSDIGCGPNVPPEEYRICHAEEISVASRGDRYLISGIYCLWPAAAPKSTFEGRFADLKKVHLSVAELAKLIQDRRFQAELAPNRVQRETVGTVAAGDFLEVEMSTDLQQDYDQPPRTVLVEMNEDLQYDVREALLGKPLGETVIMPWKWNAGQADERHLKRIFKIQARLIPGRLTDDEFFGLEQVSGWPELQEKVKAEFTNKQKQTLNIRLNNLLLEDFSFGPVPGPWAVDRAEGLYNSLLSRHKSEAQLLKMLGAKDRSAAIHGLIPQCRREILFQLAANTIARTQLQVVFPPEELVGDPRLNDWRMSLYMELEHGRLALVKSLTAEAA